MKKSTKIILLILAIAAVIAICAFLIPPVLSLRDPEVQEKFRTFIDSLGLFGVLLMLAIQVLQIIVAIIPGEPIELIMGLMYGTFGGLALTLGGILIGTTAVYFAMKRFGIGFAKKFVNVEKFEQLKFLRDPKKRDSLIFLLFFIPGTPKDVLTYFAPLTGIPFPRFLILSALARIPSVVSSTVVGASVSEGEFLRSIIIFALTGIVGLAGIYINNLITNKHNQNKESEK